MARGGADTNRVKRRVSVPRASGLRQGGTVERYGALFSDGSMTLASASARSREAALKQMGRLEEGDALVRVRIEIVKRSRCGRFEALP